MTGSVSGSISIMSAKDFTSVLNRGRVVDHQLRVIDVVLDQPSELRSGDVVVAMTHGDGRIVSLAIVADGASPEALSLRLIEHRN